MRDIRLTSANSTSNKMPVYKVSLTVGDERVDWLDVATGPTATEPLLGQGFLVPCNGYKIDADRNRLTVGPAMRSGGGTECGGDDVSVRQPLPPSHPRPLPPWHPAPGSSEWGADQDLSEPVGAPLLPGSAEYGMDEDLYGPAQH